MQSLKLSLTFILILSFVAVASANDGTQEGACLQDRAVNEPGTSFTSSTDEVYVLTAFESVSISATSVWQDNRHRAYYSDSIGSLNGFLLFDLSNIPDNSHILTLSVLCHLENAFGSPSSNPVLRIYRSDDDNWTRNSVSGGQLSLNELLVGDIPFSSYVPTYNFNLDVFAHDWSTDLQDNQLCLGFHNSNYNYSYIYFYGAYGTPTGPPPELTITTSDGIAHNVDITLTPVNPPIIIPAGGGSFDYQIDITNMETNPLTFHAWIMVVFPDGSERGPLIPKVISEMEGGGNINRELTQNVPDFLPGGAYSYIANVGVYPSEIWDSHEIPFAKEQSFDKIGHEENSELDGKPNDPVMSVSVETFSACPNPFNSQTVISFDIAEAGYCNLKIYDISGRETAKLHSGYLNAGMHSLNFTGDNLSAGVYFAVLETRGISSVYKLLYLK